MPTSVEGPEATETSVEAIQIEEETAKCELQMDHDAETISEMIHQGVVINEPSDDTSSDPSPETFSSRTDKGLKILFLSSDTGGGHRASAEALAKQFQLLFPGSTYDLLDIVEKDGVPPYNSLVSYYKHLSGRPAQWKLVYSVSNSRAFELLADTHLKLMCERAVRRRIQSYDPDVVVSVHPLMTNVPVLSCSKISNYTGKHLPMFTVVTDLGSAHCLWFANGVEKMFVGSERVKELAKVRGKVPEEKLVLAGLPIRHDFAVQAEKLGDRMSDAGKTYQQQVRKELELPFTDRKTILLMGGGEGVGSLSDITDAMYVELVSQGIDALILVVCGRNEKLRNGLKKRDWKEVVKRWRAAKERHGNVYTGGSSSLKPFTDACVPSSMRTTAGCIETGRGIGRIFSTAGSIGNAMLDPTPDDQALNAEYKGDIGEEKKAEMKDAAMQIQNSILETSGSIDNSIMDTLVESLGDSKPGEVSVVPLGFITNMADYMVAADVIVSKAGPGTISEAAALSLPVMLTSYLPGQEEGNVEYVVENGFGAYCHDSDPIGIAEELCMWLKDEEKLESLSKAAKANGRCYAARDIAKAIGDSTLKWIDLNEERHSQAEAAKKS